MGRREKWELTIAIQTENISDFAPVQKINGINYWHFSYQNLNLWQQISFQKQSHGQFSKMLGPLILNLLAVARWVNVVVGSPQYYNRQVSTTFSLLKEILREIKIQIHSQLSCRPSYRNDDISRKGNYRINGYLPLYGEDIYSGVIDSRRRYDSGLRYNSFRRSYSGDVGV